MGKIKKEVNQLIKEVGKNIEKGNSNLIALGLKASQKYMSNEEKRQQEKTIIELKKFKDSLEKISDRKIIARSLEEIKKGNKSDRLLTEEEKRIAKNMSICIDREAMIIKLFMNIEDKKQKIRDLAPNLDKYLLSNFYRSVCEITVRLFSDNLLSILVPLKGKVIDSLIKSWESKIMRDTLNLGEFRKIINEFELKLDNNINLVKLIDEYFGYKNNGGFILRNDIAHERRFLHEFDNGELINETKKINNFNKAIIDVFFIEMLQKYFSKLDYEKMKNFFN